MIEATAETVWEEQPHGYRPTIKWDGVILWQAHVVIPFEHGDYDNSQEAEAVSIANAHIVEKLREVFDE